MAGDETILARRQRLATIPRACEACKVRKIKCDRSNPCANCRTAGITCQQPGASVASRRNPNTGSTTTLEDEVKRLKERLHAVEDALLRKTVSEPVVSSASPNPSAMHEPAVASLDDRRNLYEGNSSFMNFSAEATELATSFASSETPESQGPIQDSFTHLDALLQQPRTLSSLEEYQLSPSSTSRTVQPMVPVSLALVITLMKKIKTQGAIFLSSYLINDASFIVSLCQRVYFPTDPVSLGEVTSMYGLLYILLREVAVMKAPISDSFDLPSCIALSEQNFKLGVETYEILAIPSFHNVFSLTLGIIKAQNESKPTLACSLISAAASHCQILGYHRECTYRNNPDRHSDIQRRVFWTLYVYDKGFSLLLGRGSSLQDHDIDAQYPALSTDQACRPWDQWFHLAIRLAKLQGQIYDSLYSATGSKLALEERTRQIKDIAPILRQWHADLGQIDFDKVNYPQIFSLSRRHWDLMYYSTLTCLLRASVTRSGGDITEECFQAARMSLESLLHCFAGYQMTDELSDADFSNWVLHNSSFTPFIVIFLHSIGAVSLDDVRLLEQVVQKLELVRKVSKSSERLHQVCAAFARLARQMAESRTSFRGNYNQQTDSLSLARTADQTRLDWSAFLPEQSPFDMSRGDSMHDWDCYDLDSILEGWLNGQPASTNIFSINTDM